MEAQGASWQSSQARWNDQESDSDRTTTMLQDAIPRLNVQCVRSPVDQAENRNALKPIVQTLAISDLESCLALENATFPKNERCSLERVGVAKFRVCKVDQIATISIDCLSRIVSWAIQHI